MSLAATANYLPLITKTFHPLRALVCCSMLEYRQLFSGKFHCVTLRGMYVSQELVWQLCWVSFNLHCRKHYISSWLIHREMETYVIAELAWIWLKLCWNWTNADKSLYTRNGMPRFMNCSFDISEEVSIVAARNKLTGKCGKRKGCEISHDQIGWLEVLEMKCCKSHWNRFPQDSTGTTWTHAVLLNVGVRLQ